MITESYPRSFFGQLGLRSVLLALVLLVSFVGTLIHLYSVGYMEHDPRRRVFFAYLNLFVAAMLLLVLALWTLPLDGDDKEKPITFNPPEIVDDEELEEEQPADEEPEEEQSTEKPQPQEFPDSIAIQFPVSVDDSRGKPYFLNGDSEHPVNLWKWNSYPMKALEMNATGVDKISAQRNDSQGLSAKASFKYGRYFLVIKRPLITADIQNDTQFQTGKIIPIGFNAWNGSAGETGSQKVVSSWFNLELE